MILRIQFEINRLMFKIKKIGEFYKMYKEWVIFFDNKTNESYKLKFNKQ